MAALTLKYNGNRIVPLDTVPTLKPLTDDDRSKASEQFPEIDFSRFNTRVEFADKTTKMAEEMIEAIQKRGIASPATVALIAWYGRCCRLADCLATLAKPSGLD